MAGGGYSAAAGLRGRRRRCCSPAGFASPIRREGFAPAFGASPSLRRGADCWLRPAPGRYVLVPDRAALALAATAATATLLTTVLNRLRSDRRIRRIAIDGDAWNLFSADVRYHAAVYARPRRPATALHRWRRATGTADPVNVIFRYVRQLVVDDVRQFFDIQTTRGDIRRHQHANTARFKVG